MSLPRIRRLLFCLGLLAAVASGLAADIAIDMMTVDCRDDRYSARLSLYVDVPPALARQVLTDFDHMADFIPNLTSSRLLSHTGNIFMIEQRGRAQFGPLSSAFASLRRVELLADGQLVSQQVSGSAAEMRSKLHIRSEGRGSRLDYQLDVQPGQWVPSAIGTRFMRHELNEQFAALGKEMLRRQEEAARPR